MVAATTKVVLAVVVFVLTQSFLKLILEPIQEQKNPIGEVARAMLIYVNAHHLDTQLTPIGWSTGWYDIGENRIDKGFSYPRERVRTYKYYIR